MNGIYRALLLGLGAGLLAWTPPPSVQAAATPVTLQVEFTFTDLDARPIPGATVRVVVGDEPWRQAPAAGHTFTTGPAGDARFTVQTTIDKRLKKLPTNFADSLLGRPTEPIT